GGGRARLPVAHLRGGRRGLRRGAAEKPRSPRLHPSRGVGARRDPGGGGRGDALRPPRDDGGARRGTPPRDRGVARRAATRRLRSRRRSMKNLLRSVAGGLFGACMATGVIILIEQISGRLYPPPPGLRYGDTEAMKAFMASLPTAAFLMVLLAWGLGTFAGAWV